MTEQLAAPQRVALEEDQGFFDLLDEMRQKIHTDKPSYDLLRDYAKLSRRQTGGLLSRTLFTWLNPLLLYGLKHEIDIRALEPIVVEDASERLHLRLEEAWRRYQGKRLCLPRALLASVGYHLLSPLPSCLIDSMAQIAIPLFISAVLPQAMVFREWFTRHRRVASMYTGREISTRRRGGKVLVLVGLYEGGVKQRRPA